MLGKLTLLVLSAGFVYAQDPAASNDVRSLEKRIEALEARSQGALQATWNDGVKVSSKDGAFVSQIGARLQLDAMDASEDDGLKASKITPLKDGAEIRRALIKFYGTLYSNLDYHIEYNMAGGKPTFDDAYAQFNGRPDIARIRVGQFREPMGLERLMSSRDVPFMERSLPVALTPGYNVGAMALRSFNDDRVTAAAGAFRETDPTGLIGSDDGYHFTGRLTALPMMADDKSSYIHLGVSASWQSMSEGTYRYASIPEANLAPSFADTGIMSNVDTAVACAGEFLGVDGPVSLMAEYVRTTPEVADTDVELSGWYVTASWFLTGEVRPYLMKEGVPGRVKPLKNFTDGKGAGAWELAARYSSLDLNDGLVAGRELNDVTLGVNWYMDPSTRLSLDYVRADLDSIGTADIVEARVQLDF